MSRKLLKIAALLTLVICVLLSSPISFQSSYRGANLLIEERLKLDQYISFSAIWQNLLPQLRQKTRIPILLPSQISPETETIYITEALATQSSYDIFLGYTPNCTEKHCFLGSFHASRNNDLDIEGQPASLANGITGYYKERACMNCGDSSIGWRQNGVSYLIHYKVSRPFSPADLMQQLANSAIQSRTSRSSNQQQISVNNAVVFDPPSNVRATPNGQIICEVTGFITINIYSENNGWYQTDACGDWGYIHQSQIQIQSNYQPHSSQVYCLVTDIRIGQLALRKAPRGETITGLDNNNVVSFVRGKMPWYYVRVVEGTNSRLNGLQGWVNANYLECAWD